jgi:hypothetical protein
MSSGRETPLLLTGPVVDAKLTKIGTVTDVIFDDRGAAARWAVVKTGVLSGEHLMPLGETYVDEDGRLVVSFGKTTVKHAERRKLLIGGCTPIPRAIESRRRGGPRAVSRRGGDRAPIGLRYGR